MADEYDISTNWWDSSSTKSRFNSGSSSSSSSTSVLSFAWPTELRSSMESIQPTPLSDNLHMMGLGLSSQAIDQWNQSLLRERPESSVQSTLQENTNSSPSSYKQETHDHGIGSSQIQWREERIGFSLDQSQFNPHGGGSSDSTVSCQSFQSIDSSIVYGSHSSTFNQNQEIMLGTEHDHSNQAQQAYQFGANYGMTGNYEMLPSNWTTNDSKALPPFLRNSTPSQQQATSQAHLQFSNNAPFWNASATNITDIRPSFFPFLLPQFASTSFQDKPKQNQSEVGDSTTIIKKSGSEAETTKRPRNESHSPLTAFKVRKEKMGDRITALQQLVSPFGKTDTASVLSEAIDYIKLLHDHVTVLSTPYMKSGASINHLQSTCDKSKDHEGHKQQDLKSRGLCLVPISSTFPVTHETVDFWTPTFH